MFFFYLFIYISIAYLVTIPMIQRLRNWHLLHGLSRLHGQLLRGVLIEGHGAPTTSFSAPGAGRDKRWGKTWGKMWGKGWKMWGKGWKMVGTWLENGGKMVGQWLESC